MNPFPPDHQRCRMHDALDRRCPNKEAANGFCNYHLLVAEGAIRNIVAQAQDIVASGWAYPEEESA